MKKILMIGGESEEWNAIAGLLETQFAVKRCSVDTEVFSGMMRLVSPDLVLVDLNTFDISCSRILSILRKDYLKVSVILLGTSE